MGRREAAFSRRRNVTAQKRIQNNVIIKAVSQPKHAINTKTLLNSTGDTDQWLDSHNGRFTSGPLVESS